MCIVYSYISRYLMCSIIVSLERRYYIIRECIYYSRPVWGVGKTVGTNYNNILRRRRVVDDMPRATPNATRVFGHRG